MAISQKMDLSAWEVLMLTSGGMWGTWFSLWGNALADSDRATLWLSNALATDAGLATAGLLISPLLHVHPTRIGIANLAGMSGAALASLGAALTTDNSDTIIIANLAGSTLGIGVGAIVAGRLKLKHSSYSGLKHFTRKAARLDRWHPSISVLPYAPNMGMQPTGEAKGWYVNVSAVQPVR
jgi:hypothetical protein